MAEISKSGLAKTWAWRFFGMQQRSLDHRIVRPDFILEHFAKRKEEWEMRLSLIETRDALHRELNKEYGFIGPDGIVSPGCVSYANAAYKAKYDDISSNFQMLYDKISVREKEAARLARITIYEYLLTESTSEHERAALIENAKNGGFDDWIQTRAKGTIREIIHNTFAEMNKIVDDKIRSFGYAGTRCRKFLDIGVFDIGARYAIAQFRNDYGRALRREIGNLRPERP